MYIAHFSVQVKSSFNYISVISVNGIVGDPGTDSRGERQIKRAK